MSFTFAGRFGRRSFHDFDLTLIVLCFYIIPYRLLDSTFVITFVFAAPSWSHFPLHLGSFSFHPFEFLSILIFFPFQLVFDLDFLVDLFIFIELSVAETLVRLPFCFLVLQTEKRMVIFASIILKFG